MAKDRSGNLLKSQKAEYNEITKIFRTIGATNLKTSENYIIESSDIFLDNKKYYKIEKTNYNYRSR